VKAVGLAPRDTAALNIIAEAQRTMHGPMSIGMILLVGAVAVAGIATGLQLPIAQDDENGNAIAAPAQLADLEISRLHRGCMTGPLRADDFPDSVQVQYCSCYAEGAADTLTAEQIRVVAVVFEKGAAGLDEEFKDMSRSQAAALSKRMNAINSIDQGCRKRLYDAILNHPSMQNRISVRSDPRVTAFYDTCVIGLPHQKVAMHGQLAFCGCYAREALNLLQPTDIRTLTTTMTDGEAALEAHIKRMSEAEQRGFAERVGRFNETVPKKCLKVGMEAVRRNN
jgi:hypothetical protein